MHLHRNLINALNETAMGTIEDLGAQNSDSFEPLTFCLEPFAFSLFPHLLIAEPILVPAVRALPGDGIAGHPPYVFIHAFLTDMESAATPPAEAKFPTAAMA